MNNSSTNNSGKMGNMGEQIREHMMVHAQGEGSMNGVPGEHVGTVDYLEGDHIVLTKNDAPDGQHHSISMDLVDPDNDVPTKDPTPHTDIHLPAR
jgi:hypothetical protein